MKNFVKFGNDSLVKFFELNFPMQQLRISTRLVDFRGLYSILDNWIDLAAVSGVRDLDVCIQTDRDKLYILPQKIFSAKSVITLELTGCKLEQPFDSLRFCSLKILTLRNVHMNDQILQKLTTELPLLENLYIHSCWGIKCFCISKSLKLKIIRICVSLKDHLESIKIVVPSLQKILLSFEDLPRSSRVIDLSGCPHLKDLILIGVIFKDQEFHDFISKFPLLEYLDVERCCFLGRFMVSSNQLKELLISDCDNLKAIDVDTPNLQFFFLYETNPVPISSINAPCPLRVEFDCGGVDAHWYLNVKEFLRASKQNCYLIIHVKSSWWFCEELLNDDANCCDSHHIKCWRHYLKGCRIESA